MAEFRELGLGVLDLGAQVELDAVGGGVALGWCGA